MSTTNATIAVPKQTLLQLAEEWWAATLVYNAASDAVTAANNAFSDALREAGYDSDRGRARALILAVKKEMGS